MKIITEGHKRYILDPRYQKKRADVFGHNGLEVGDWWPFQSFALRDGAHGSKMGGIYGRTSEGAYSVVVAGGIYEDNDSDSGDTLLYSGSKGSDNEDARNIAPLTTATRSLIMSTKHHQPVRVLRAAKKGNNRWAPTHGIRYDGLYNVTSYKIETDAKGLKFYQFVLTRCSGQRAIDRSRPTREEIAALERIREL
ncbi:PUA-like domain-containing protein [Kalaharituber pfeilii]|nr:PUA-like domain-containing protein [Kalaharituber pfeilii]